MEIRVKNFRFLFGIIISIVLAPDFVQLQVAENCVVCDSVNEGDRDCGSEIASESTKVAACDPALGCFSVIYDNADIWSPALYTRRGCYVADQECGALCELCEDGSCHEEVYPLDRHKCYQCVDGDCMSIKSDYCSLYLEGSQNCVTLFDQDGAAILRSCLSDIVDSTRELCRDESYHDCKMCTGENCNTDSKRDGTKCHKCTGSDCLIIDTTANLVDCTSSCYIGLNENHEPVRGCASDFTNIDQCSSVETSTKECFVCDNDECNSIVYPMSGRLKCHTCAGASCEPTESNLELCTMYGNDEKCATVFDGTSVIARGCMHDLQTDYENECLNNGTNCLKCAYDKCNKDDSLLKTEFCIGCDSSVDSNCLRDKVNTEIRCTTNKCFTRLATNEDSSFRLQRGCFADLIYDCSSPDCTSCEGKNCNNKVFPEKRISCKACELESCGGQEVDKMCSNYLRDEACLTVYGEDNQVAVRNCYADVPSELQSLCDDPANLECTTCKGNLCNTDTKRRGNKCYKCEGIECGKLDISNEIECMSECYVGVNQNGDPKRDCGSSMKNASSCGVTDQSCLTCNDDYCNAITYPLENRISCKKCFGEDCASSEELFELCERWRSDEKCVSIFDQGGTVVERGCSSSLLSLAVCSGNTATCLNCTYDNCNIESSPTQKFHCVSCDSQEDMNCISNPNATATIGCTTNECFSQVLSSGQKILRGCGVVQQCNTSTCQSCTGERCNSQVFPANRHSCLHCVGDQCALGPLQAKFCLIYNQQDTSCITIYGAESEMIYRDCYVDAASETRAVCDENDISCTKCSGRNCNNDMSRRGSKCFKCDGIECFGAAEPSNSIDCLTRGCYVGLGSNGGTKRDCLSAITDSSKCVTNDTSVGDCLKCNDDYCNAIAFPIRNRLICKECLGESCEGNSLSDKYCERLHQDERCVSVFNAAGGILERGCSSTVQSSSICASSTGSNCMKCSFNYCNTQRSLLERYQCATCDSREDPSCGSVSTSPRTKPCSTAECYSRNLRVASNSTWSYTERGCFVDLMEPNTCTESSCSTCTGDVCNNLEVFPSGRISCLSCRGESCRNATIPSTICQWHNSQRQACVTFFGSNGEVALRGCYSDAADGTKDVCDDTTQISCTKCATRNCNSAVKRRGYQCFKCEGTDCFNSNYPADIVDCTSSCYIGVNAKGENVRGCASSFQNTTACGQDDNSSAQCLVCSDDFCNGIQFPLQNRLQCEICEGEACDASNDNLGFCENLNPQESCVAIFSGEDKAIERGCSSTIARKQYCSQNYENCIYCSTNGCNQMTSKTSHLCVVCDSSNDSNCILNPTAISSIYCQQGCFSRLVNQTLHRGCYEDLGANFKCVEENNCQYCNDVDKCNTDTYPKDRRSCRTCAGQENCRNTTSELCLNYKANDACVTVFTQYSVTRKGCLADQPTNDQLLCNGINTSCISCLTRDNCNIETVRADESCISCSSALNPMCSQNPAVLVSEHCSIESDGQCFSRIMNGATVRGCKGLLSSSEVDGCQNNTATSQCIISTGRESNNRVFPQNRKLCYHCDSRVESSCFNKPTNETMTRPCVRFSQPESCLKLVLGDNSSSIIRGCTSDFSLDICSQGKCYTCDNNDGCNSSSMSHLHMLCAIFSVLLLSLVFKTDSKV